MSLIAFDVVSTTKLPVGGTVTTTNLDQGVSDPNANNNKKPWLVRVWSDVNVHVRVSPSSNPIDATEDDLPVADHGDGVLLSLPPDASLSFIKKTGEPDGEIWLSHIKRV